MRGRRWPAGGESLSKALYNTDKNILATVLLSYEPPNTQEIGEIADLMMRAFHRQFNRDERAPLRPDLRTEIIARLQKWATQLLDDPNTSRHALHHLAEAMATFPDAKLLRPLRSLIEADLKRWREEKAEFNAARERGQILHNSGARMSYQYRYGQNILSLATGRDPDVIRDNDDDEKTPPSKELQDAVIDGMSGFLADPEFGAEAARVLANLRPNPIFSIGKSGLGHFNVKLVEQRRAARREGGSRVPDPVAARILDTLPPLLAEGSVNAEHGLRLALSAARMECGERFEEVRKLVLERGSIENITEFLKLSLQLGYEVDGLAAERCLHKLDARRSERKWEYSERWYQWQELLELMIFGGMPMQAAERLLTYDTNTRDYSLRRVLEALASCGHPDAMPALLHLKDHCANHHSSSDWAGALADLNTVEAGDALFSFLIEPTTKRDWHRERDLTRFIARIAGRLSRAPQSNSSPRQSTRPPGDKSHLRRDLPDRQ